MLTTMSIYLYKVRTYHLFVLFENQVKPQTARITGKPLVSFPSPLVSPGAQLWIYPSLVLDPAPISSLCFRAKTCKGFHSTICPHKENNSLCHKQIEGY